MDDLRTDDDGKVSTAPDQSKFVTLREWVMADIEHSSAWRSGAKEDFSFVAGPGQWSEEDRQFLREEERPVLTFNRVLKYVRAICGIEANNRHETTYIPRELDNEGEVKVNEVLSAGSNWMAAQCNADRQQSRAFRDAVICGMGWTEQALSYDDDPKGQYVETRCDPLEMFWDRNARDQNLMDAKRVGRVRKMLLSEARALLPGVTDAPGVLDSDLDAYWAAGAFDYRSRDAKSQEQKELREENQVKDDPKREVHIVHIQWWEYENYKYAFNPATNKAEAMDEATFQQIKEQAAMMGIDVPFTTLRRKKYLQAFVGNKVLQMGPCPRPDGFTFQCITHEPDDVAGVWFGIVRILKDPQLWSNKWISQVMHMVNTTAKGGVIIEDDAVGDVREFQKNYAKPQAASVVRSGAISKGKIMGKPGTANLSGIMGLLEIAQQAFPDVTGMNLELMGMADRDQPGILEAQRKQAAMTILATLFDSLSLFRVEVGRARLHYLQTALADGRLIRVAGPDAEVAIPLLKDKVTGKYDVIVDDAPTSPNTKEKTWATIQMLLPPLLQAGMVPPKMILKLLDYVPFLPSKLVQAFKQIAAEPEPGDAEKAALAQRGAVAEVADKEAAAKLKDAQAQATDAKMLLDLAEAGSQQAQAEAAREVRRFGGLLNSLVSRRVPPMQPEAPQQQIATLPMLGSEPMQAAPLQQTSAEPAAMPNDIALPGGLNGGAR